MYKTYSIPLECIEEQLEAVFEDIPPLAIKIGMLFSAAIIELVAHFLAKHAQKTPIILDPVMVAKGGASLMHNDALAHLKNKLIPLCDVITPNVPEALVLAPGPEVKHDLVKRLLELGSRSVLLKGGHELSERSDDLFASSNSMELLSAPRIRTKNTHGTGCTLSAAIASYMAQGAADIEACKKAKNYLHMAIHAAQNKSVGNGNGPVHHSFMMNPVSNPYLLSRPAK